MSSYHCIFCLKPTTPPTRTPSSSSSGQFDSGGSIRRALTLLERLLRLEPSSTKCSSSPVYYYYNACRSCSSALETFCGLYEQLKGLELRLEWEVAKLRGLVEHANRVPTRGAWVKQCYQQQQLGGGEEEGPQPPPRPHSQMGMMDKMYSWRRSFSKRCLTRLTSNFPKVLISKLELEPTSLALIRGGGGGGASEGHHDDLINHECEDDDDDDGDSDSNSFVYSPSSTAAATTSTSASTVTVQDCIEPLPPGTGKRGLYLAKLLPNPPKVFTPIKLFTPVVLPPKSGIGFRNEASAAAGLLGHQDHDDRNKLEGRGSDLKVEEMVMVKHDDDDKDDEDEDDEDLAAGEQKSETPKKVGHRRTTTTRRGRGPSLKTCPVCNVGFKKACNLTRHMSCAHDLEAAGMTDQSEAFQCSQCPAWFTTRRCMGLHIEKLHKPFFFAPEQVEGRKVTCAKCGDDKDWKCKTKLERHQRFCDGRGGRRIWCTQCRKKFKNLADKRLHIVAAHGGLKCDQPRCQFVTRNPLSLERHRGGDRCPFPAAWICTRCGDGRNWENRTNFERHVKLCRGGALEGAGLAAGAGRRPSTSTVTAAFRKGKRPYYCAVCSKLFFSKNARAIHFSINHGGSSGLMSRGDVVVKRCGRPGCSAYFRTRAQLRNHEKEFHHHDGGGGTRNQKKSQGLMKAQLLAGEPVVLDPLVDDEMVEAGDHYLVGGDGCEPNVVHQDVDDEEMEVKFVLPH